MRVWAFLLISVLLAAPARVSAEYQLARAFPGLTFNLPTDIQHPSDGTFRLFVVEKSGLIYVFPAYSSVTPADRRVFLDLTNKVSTIAENGLLGLAFHPNYKSNGYFFVFFVTPLPYRSVVARYRVSADPNVADAASEVLLIDNPQVNRYHNGGQLAFGRDGMLYVAMGDNRISGTAQDLTDLPGSILRIDVDVTAAAGPSSLSYEIPPDNPFAGNHSGYREEIFAYGFRNPWRFSIDRATGEIWTADVGEDTYEEINLVQRGRNYGWPLMEGPACFEPSTCDTTGQNLVLPLYAYDHAEGVAVIGGHRYWSTWLPELAGLYIFADYTGGKVWALQYDGAGIPERSDLVLNSPVILTFGVGPDPTRDLYAGSSDGYIYHLERAVTRVEGGTAPSAGRLVGNFPNPFNPSTTIRYRLARAGRVVIEIVSVDGRRIGGVDVGNQPTGVHDVRWTGETDRGTRAASGVYFCRLIVDGVALDAHRMVLVQ